MTTLDIIKIAVLFSVILVLNVPYLQEEIKKKWDRFIYQKYIEKYIKNAENKVNKWNTKRLAKKELEQRLN